MVWRLNECLISLQTRNSPFHLANGSKLDDIGKDEMDARLACVTSAREGPYCKQRPNLDGMIDYPRQLRIMSCIMSSFRSKRLAKNSTRCAHAVSATLSVIRYKSASCRGSVPHIPKR